MNGPNKLCCLFPGGFSSLVLYDRIAYWTHLQVTKKISVVDFAPCPKTVVLQIAFACYSNWQKLSEQSP